MSQHVPRWSGSPWLRCNHGDPRCYSACQVDPSVAAHACMTSLAPLLADGAVTHWPEPALTISVPIGSVPTPRSCHLVAAAPEHDPTDTPDPVAVRQLLPSWTAPFHDSVQCWALVFAQLARTTVDPDTAMHLPALPDSTLAAGRSQ
jgi:hypothetical protein